MRSSFLFAAALLAQLQVNDRLSAEDRKNTLEKSPSRYATSAGRRIHYKAIGSGDVAVVFIHGWTCDLTFWSPQAEHFAGKHSLLFIDLPGHGKSDKPKDGDYTMDYFAD